jgi:uncharacterized membrane protein
VKGFVVLMTVSGIIALIVAFVVFPSLQASVNKAQANAAYAEQQKLLAQAEVEKARALTVTAKGEADALRMSINQPIALLAIPMALLAMVSVVVLVLTFARQKPQPRQERDGPHLQARTISVLVDGQLETLYVGQGQDPTEVVQHFLLARASRGLVVWVDR